MALLDFFKFAICIFFAYIFLGAIFIKPDPSLSNPVIEDPRKEVFMEDCLSVSINTKQDCNQIFKDLTGNR